MSINNESEEDYSQIVQQDKSRISLPDVDQGELLNHSSPDNYDDVSIDPKGDISYIKPRQINATVASMKERDAVDEPNDMNFGLSNTFSEDLEVA